MDLPPPSATTSAPPPSPPSTPPAVVATLWLAIAHVVAGLVLCLSIIGIPFGVACFKLAGLALVPFGKTVVPAGAPLPPGSTVYVAV